MSCGVGHRHGSDLVWLWLWLRHRPAAVALIGPLAWEHPYVMSAALERKKKKSYTTLFHLVPISVGPCHACHSWFRKYIFKLKTNLIFTLFYPIRYSHKSKTRCVLVKHLLSVRGDGMVTVSIDWVFTKWEYSAQKLVSIISLYLHNNLTKQGFSISFGSRNHSSGNLYLQMTREGRKSKFYN